MDGQRSDLSKSDHHPVRAQLNSYSGQELCISDAPFAECEAKLVSGWRDMNLHRPPFVDGWPFVYGRLDAWYVLSRFDPSLLLPRVKIADRVSRPRNSGNAN